MPIIENPKHERFAQCLAKGMTADEAYVQAGYSENRGNATRLKANESVMKRVAELQGKVAERIVVTVESLLREAEEARVLAMSLKKPAAAVAAIKEKGVLSGVRIEKSELKNVADLTRLSDDEIDAEIAALTRDEAASASAGKPH